MECESAVTQSIIDEFHSSDLKGGQRKGESGVTRRIINEPHSWDIQGDQMEGKSGFTWSIIDELHWICKELRSSMIL